MTDYGLEPALYYAGAYHDVDPEQVAAAGVAYSRGVTDEWDLQKGTCSLRIIDDADDYRPTNPESALYGIVGAYLPFRHRVDAADRFAGVIDKLQPGQTDDHQPAAGLTTRGVRWVDLAATDAVGTVGRWRNPISSPLYLQIRSLPTLRGYWPGEDARGSTVMSSAYAGAAAAAVTGVTFDNADGPAGSNSLLTLGSAALIQGTFPTDISTTAWQVSWTTDLAGADATGRQAFAWRTSNDYWWVWQASETGYRMIVIDGLGNTLLDSPITNGGAGPGENLVFRIKASRAGSTWTVEPAWYSEASPVLIGFTDTFSGAAGRPTIWKTGTNTVMNGAYFGHVFATTTTADSLQSYAMLSAINGYPGETTADRFERMCGLRNIPATVLGDTDYAVAMGPQAPGTIKAQLQEIQRTEQGLIFGSRDGNGLTLALRRYLVEQANTPALELTYPDHVAPGLVELDTAQELFNVVVAQDRSGTTATAQEPDGRYGTADPPDGAGVIDQKIDTNLDDAADVEQLASSYLRYYQQVAQFGPITVDLDANPGLRAGAEAVDVGMCIELAGRTPDPQRLLVIRVSGRDQLKRSTITFEVVPAGLFSTGVWDAVTDVRRWDLRTCTLSAGVNTTATALTLAITDDESWSTTAEPYDFLIGGERVTVTSMAARTGSGPYQQVATVTRSVNGVVKSHAAAAEVHIADKGIPTW